MKTALWFSRHEPTVEQLEEISNMGLTLALVEKGCELGAVDLQGWKEAQSVLATLMAMASEVGTSICFGVFPAPFQQRMFCAADASVQRGDWLPGLTCFASWNVKRTTEGGVPTFQHYLWVPVGVLPKG
jgi:hypothetical protein